MKGSILFAPKVNMVTFLRVKFCNRRSCIHLMWRGPSSEWFISTGWISKGFPSELFSSTRRMSLRRKYLILKKCSISSWFQHKPAFEDQCEQWVRIREKLAHSFFWCIHLTSLYNLFTSLQRFNCWACGLKTPRNWNYHWPVVYEALPPIKWLSIEWLIGYRQSRLTKACHVT